jgi:hypothetical protein
MLRGREYEGTGGNYIMNELHHLYCYGDQLKDNAISEACSTHEINKKNI